VVQVRSHPCRCLSLLSKSLCVLRALCGSSIFSKEKTGVTVYVMGIDGGGSAIRVVITTPDLTVRGQRDGPTVNPGVVGFETAARTIRDAMRAALASADLTPNQITAVGIGIAGAAAHHSAGWLREVVAAVTPHALIIPSADFEIALVGAVGRREGVLVLAGTGSLAYGVNAAGRSALVGGWGYLLDDAGSGYWIGIRALAAVARAADGRGPQTSLTSILLEALDLAKPLDLIGWLYHSETARTRAVAQLAPLVLDRAARGDLVAQVIITGATAELTQAAHTVMRRLDMPAPDFAFAGGLLSQPNLLSESLCAALGLDALPVPHHPPVIGAALLALESRM
jgi:N-acetylglucosamine kinase-like BadF-type ATPase